MLLTKGSRIGVNLWRKQEGTSENEVEVNQEGHEIGKLEVTPIHPLEEANNSG